MAAPPPLPPRPKPAASPVKPPRPSVPEEERVETDCAYGVDWTRGRRRAMEDCHFVGGAMLEDGTGSLFVVFDGHGGYRCAELAKRRFASTLKETPDFPAPESFVAAISALDKEVCKTAEEKGWEDGSTITALFVAGDCVTVAHLGDSRAVLVTADGARALTVDHKPTVEEEEARVVSAGGVVLRGRVNGILAVSRALGDRRLKPAVSATADVLSWKRSEGEVAVIVASDGLWDVLSNEEAAAIVRDCSDASAAAVALVEEAKQRFTADNTTAIVVYL
eukprot:PLAT7433.1.p1 GENE.PLAT7433.1~~PLAT7433.1.p1  ORF type:complete len:288 (+),score=65.29 PLAT7433.1:32-865(+)